MSSSNHNQGTPSPQNSTTPTTPVSSKEKMVTEPGDVRGNLTENETIGNNKDPTQTSIGQLMIDRQAIFIIEYTLQAAARGASGYQYSD